MHCLRWLKQDEGRRRPSCRICNWSNVGPHVDSGERKSNESRTSLIPLSMPPKASGSTARGKIPTGKLSDLATKLYNAVLDAEDKVNGRLPGSPISPEF
jgi:hypothetical protein